MADVSIAYKGAVIARLDDSGTKVLKTGGTFCEGDLTVAYRKPENAGTATEEDIAFGQTAWVNGTLVEGAMRRRVYEGVITETVIGQQKYASLVQDGFLASHKDEEGLFVRVIFHVAPTPHTVAQCWAFNNALLTPIGTETGHQHIYRYDSSGGRNISSIAPPLNTTTPASVGCVQITADGELRVYSNSSSNYAIRPCNFTVVVEW